jgi:hypothetical protein
MARVFPQGLGARTPPGPIVNRNRFMEKKSASDRALGRRAL